MAENGLVGPVTQKPPEKVHLGRFSDLFAKKHMNILLDAQHGGFRVEEEFIRFFPFSI